MVSLMLKRIPIHRFRWLYLIVPLSPNYFIYTYCILLPILIYPHNIGISSRFQVISRVAAPTGLFLWHLFPTRHFDGTLQINCWVIPCDHVLFRNKDPGVVQKISSLLHSLRVCYAQSWIPRYTKYDENFKVPGLSLKQW